MIKDMLQVDAFSRRPLYGNPAAVVFDADDLSSGTMQQIAKEMNLSETVFILKPAEAGADYRVRIFTPMSELPFAGHPTVAAAHAVRFRFPELSAKPLLRQECGIGIVPVEVIPGKTGVLLRMTQAAPSFAETNLTPDLVALMLGCDETDLAGSPIQVVSTGVPWLIVELARFETISALAPDLTLIQRTCDEIKAGGVTIFVETAGSSPARIRLRTFAPGAGVAEDPVCGSGNGSVAAFIARHKQPGERSGAYQAEQGIEINRDGEIEASWSCDGDDLTIKIGGQAVTVLSGQLHLEDGSVH